MSTNPRPSWVVAAILWALSLTTPSWCAEGDPGKPTPQQEFERVLMADYRGINRDSTVQARIKQLATFKGVSHIRVEVRDWPNKLMVGDPTGQDIERLDDGDRGFVWQMSLEQVQVLIMGRVAKKNRLTVIIHRDAEADRSAITTWASGQGFAQVVFE